MADPDGRLDQRRALVTGAARGIGRAICLALADAGAEVALVDIDTAENSESAQHVMSLGGTAHAFTADIAKRDAAERVIAVASDAMGGLDILVHNAGLMYSMTGLEQTDDDDFDRLHAVNVKGPIYLTRAALPFLRASDTPRVIFISSQWGQVPDGHSYGYMTAKAAQLGLSKTMAKELTPAGILVNAIAPGAVRTRLVPEENYESEIGAIPLGRLAEPSEIAAVVVFLASGAGSFIAGQTIPVNGGAWM